nr:RNA-directed DNA polymerase, eukaryota [Tanacetum cinerariifolium]
IRVAFLSLIMSDRNFHNSYENETQKISKSVFVTNFPEDFSACDLRKVCSDYGTVVDVFIPFKRSKSGKRFAFVRFINVINLERLVSNLCTIWIGRYHLHANYVRFERPQKPNSSIPRRPNHSTPKEMNMENSKKSFVYVFKRGSQSHVTPEITKPVLVLDETCIKEFDFGMSLMGRAKDVSAIPNIPCIISKECFQNVKLSYLRGMWVLFEFDSLASKEKFLNHSGSSSLFTELIQATSSFENDEWIVWISIEGLHIKAWTPNTFRKIAFLCEDDEDDLSSDGESQEGDVANKDDNNESDVVRESKSNFMHENDTAHKDNNVCNSCSDEPKFLHGFTPDYKDQEKNMEENIKDTTERVQSLSNKLNDRCSNRGFLSQRSMNSHSHKSKVGGSMLDLMDELVTVGQTMGYNRAGLGNKAKRRWIKGLCQKHRTNFAYIQETKAESISLHTIKDLWRNRMFDHVVRSSVGCSGAIDYLRTFIDRWEGNTVIMGYFNGVRSKHERFGSTFNKQGAIAFNNFISSACLIDLPLEGYAFTWAHKSALKMSKLDRYLISECVLDLFPHLSALCLDRHLFDHRPILLQETNYDYGHSSFRVFHSWFAMDGFNSFVETTWKSLNIFEPNSLIRLKKKLQALKIAIKAWSKEANKRSNDRKINIQQNLSEIYKLIDQGKSDDEILIKRITLLNDLEELNNRNAIQISQKTKSDGPLKVKKTPNISMQFSHIQAPSICFDFTFPTRQSSYQVQDLKRTVTYEEVKRAIWDCGTNKSPGPDGFSFEFYCKYWTTIDDDVFQTVRDFFVNGHFPRGCNSSFITLIPKIQDAKFVKDFRSISLIGSVYKIIAKILANRLCVVLPYLISGVQSAFVANRQILDGPFIINELLSWCKFKKLHGMIFKVDFEKDFDYVKWDDLDKTIKAFGIGVSSNVVAAAASLIGCSILTAPFNYLGVKNLFYGVDGSDRKLAWIGWNMVLTSKKNGGLGVSSFFAHNRALVFKRVWRFLTDGSSLWTHFINVIFGNKGALDIHKLIPRRSQWQDIIIAIHSLQSKGEVALKVLYKRLYALEMCKSISVAEKIGHPSLSHSFRRMPIGGVEQENYGLLCSKVGDLVLSNISDKWCWSLEGPQKFSVKSSCNLIDNTILPKAEVSTRWLRVIPIKVNVHAWRVCLDKLPTIANISLRGMDIPSIVCPICNSAMESSSHIFLLVLCLAKFGENFDLVGT